MTPLEVLKNKEKGIVLYSPCYGNVKFLKVNANHDYPIEFEDEKGHNHAFTAKGKFTDDLTDTQVMLFPSVNLKEWDKFNFKKGDVLQHDEGMESVEFISYETSVENPANNYTMFKGKIITPIEHQGEIDYFTTWCFSPVKVLDKSRVIRFKPFEKVLYIRPTGYYHIGFVEKCLENDYICLMNVEDCVPNHVVFPYKESMECLIGECDNEKSSKKLKEILENE